MKLLLFGATGMIGQGALREALLDDGVGEVLAVGRHPTGRSHPKLRELLHRDFADLSPIEGQLAGYDACLYCLGVSSGGMAAAEYERITYGYTLAAAETLARIAPGMTFIYVSGAGTDASERGRTRWARVKGKTENALLRLPFRAAFMFRPGLIIPLHGITSRTATYRFLYAVLAPLSPVLARLAPQQLLTTESLGRAMLRAAAAGAPKQVLLASDIQRLAQQ